MIKERLTANKTKTPWRMAAKTKRMKKKKIQMLTNKKLPVGTR